MKKILYYIFLLIIFSCPNAIFAKRVFIDYPDEVSINGVCYKASYSENILFHKAYVKAIDTKTDAILWKKKIYTTFINPFIEQDVQWVLIKEILYKNGALIIENEKSIEYILDLETLKLSK